MVKSAGVFVFGCGLFQIGIKRKLPDVVQIHHTVCGGIIDVVFFRENQHKKLARRDGSDFRFVQIRAIKSAGLSGCQIGNLTRDGSLALFCQRKQP